MIWINSVYPLKRLKAYDLFYKLGTMSTIRIRYDIKHDKFLGRDGYV